MDLVPHWLYSTCVRTPRAGGGAGTSRTGPSGRAGARPSRFLGHLTVIYGFHGGAVRSEIARFLCPPPPCWLYSTCVRTPRAGAARVLRVRGRPDARNRAKRTPKVGGATVRLGTAARSEANVRRGPRWSSRPPTGHAPHYAVLLHSAPCHSAPYRAVQRRVADDG